MDFSKEHFVLKNHKCNNCGHEFDYTEDNMTTRAFRSISSSGLGPKWKHKERTYLRCKYCDETFCIFVPIIVWKRLERARRKKQKLTYNKKGI